jgi:hypothetical protein
MSTVVLIAVCEEQKEEQANDEEKGQRTRTVCTSFIYTHTPKKKKQQ